MFEPLCFCLALHRVLEVTFLIQLLRDCFLYLFISVFSLSLPLPRDPDLLHSSTELHELWYSAAITMYNIYYSSSVKQRMDPSWFCASIPAFKWGDSLSSGWPWSSAGHTGKQRGQSWHSVKQCVMPFGGLRKLMQGRAVPTQTLVCTNTIRNEFNHMQSGL